MSSVTGRINEIKQPRGGYLKVSEFSVTTLEDNKNLNDDENVHSSIVGMAADYMTRFLMGTELKEAFKISIMGANMAEKMGYKDAVKEITEYINKINGLDNSSIINACKATTFDVWFRNPFSAMMAKRANETTPDSYTIENIRIMVERSLTFWKKYGPIKVDGFTFETDGYTKTVNSGDGDFLTENTMWDFKVSKSSPKANHTLQLLMYYVMGKHSGKQEFKNINKLGIYNPRLNIVYQYDIEKLPKEIIKEIEDNVICY